MVIRAPSHVATDIRGGAASCGMSGNDKPARKHPAELEAQLQATGVFALEMPPLAVSIRHRLVSAFGGLLTTLFLFAYLGLIPLAAWGVYRLNAKITLASAVGPICLSLIGCLLILSLVKPLVARPGRVAEPHRLDPEKQPLLFKFVKELASRGQMPEPSHLAVDWSVNCYCVFAGGITGISRRDFDLVIGLSLVSGLSLDQLAGVLAHELGHVAHRSAMWSSRLMWNVEAWFSRVTGERDRFDLAVLDSLKAAGPASKLLLECAQWLVVPGRAVLRLMRLVEGAVSAGFLRRMEIEADRYQVRVAGTEAFLATILETNLLAVASQRAVVDLSRMWQRRRLVDDFPGLIASLRRGYSAAFVQRLRAGMEKSGNRIFSTHPSDRDRMAFARAQATRGLLTPGLPAAALFADYQELCRQATLDYYDRDLRLEREGCNLVPLANVLDERKAGP